MYRVAAVTFHHAHNFGSALQAYALQETVKKIGRDAGTEIEYCIIDYFTEVQEALYAVHKRGNSPQNIAKNLLQLPYVGQLKKKHDKFEAFLQDYCQLTRRFQTAQELAAERPPADCYISGSDQLWNVRTKDFSDVYYLDFAPNTRKISYAASFGPLKIDWEKYDKEKYQRLLERYSAISVREPGSAENIRLLTGKDCEIHVDPTLLLSAAQWREIQSEANYKGGQYILLYCLEPSKQQLEMAKKISKKVGLPIVVLRYNNKNDMINPFVKRYDSGPRDFLSYIDHAALVLTSSFHGTAFSLIYRKPFYVFDGMADHRISSILSKTGFENRSIKSSQDVPEITLQQPDATNIQGFLEQERARSIAYLKGALEL